MHNPFIFPNLIGKEMSFFLCFIAYNSLPFFSRNTKRYIIKGYVSRQITVQEDGEEGIKHLIKPYYMPGIVPGALFNIHSTNIY